MITFIYLYIHYTKQTTSSELKLYIIFSEKDVKIIQKYSYEQQIIRVKYFLHANITDVKAI